MAAKLQCAAVRTAGTGLLFPGLCASRGFGDETGLSPRGRLEKQLMNLKEKKKKKKKEGQTPHYAWYGYHWGSVAVEKGSPPPQADGRIRHCRCAGQAEIPPSSCHFFGGGGGFVFEAVEI